MILTPVQNKRSTFLPLKQIIQSVFTTNIVSKTSLPSKEVTNYWLSLSIAGIILQEREADEETTPTGCKTGKFLVPDLV